MVSCLQGQQEPRRGVAAVKALHNFQACVSLLKPAYNTLKGGVGVSSDELDRVHVAWRAFSAISDTASADIARHLCEQLSKEGPVRILREWMLKYCNEIIEEADA